MKRKKLLWGLGVIYMKFNIDDYKGKYAMHCKTKEEARDFCNYLHSLGQKWRNGDSYLSNTNWETYRSSTCYDFNSNEYSGKDFFEKYNYTILEWEDFMKNNFTKEDLKPGDILVTKSKGKYMYIGDHMVCSKDWIGMEEYDKNLKLKNRGLLRETDSFDVVKVLRPKGYTVLERHWEYADLIWKREETVEMTLEEVCEALGKNIKIVKSK